MLGDPQRPDDDKMEFLSINELVPRDHFFRQLHSVLDLSWIRAEVAPLYSSAKGRPSLDPEAMVRLMLAGLVYGIRGDRELMARAQTDVAIRWFAGYRLAEKLPDHSSFTRTRQRWGVELFRRIFLRTVQQCIDAGLVDGSTVHVDASLVRADAGMKSYAEAYVDEAWESGEASALDREETSDSEDDDGPPDRGASDPATPGAQEKKRKISRTDPDASFSSSRRGQRCEPSYKVHSTVDDRSGVLLDLKVTTGVRNEGLELRGQLERSAGRTGVAIDCVTADKSYSHGRNYAWLEDAGIEALIPPQGVGRNGKTIPASSFQYDEYHDVVLCPAGRKLTRRTRDPQGWRYGATTAECGPCPLCRQCVPKSGRTRRILIVDGYTSLLRARRRDLRSRICREPNYRRHLWRAEGAFAEMKSRHGLARAARRGLEGVWTQVLLTGALLNLKRLVKAALSPLQGAWSALKRALTGLESPLNLPNSSVYDFQLLAA